MKIFRYKEDKLPVFIFTLYFLIDLTIYFRVDNIYFLIFWFLLGIFPKANIAAWNHHHQHLKTFNYGFLNICLEIIYTFHTGISSNTWVLHHNFGHHLNYLDQEKDESRWQDKNGNKMGVLKYTFIVALTSYWRAFKVGGKHQKIRNVFITMIFVCLIILIGLTYYRPLQSLLVFILPMISSLLMTSYATYAHHTDLSLDDHNHASRNIESKWYNILTGNLGYHTAHHIRFGLHWSKLPELHKEIRDKIPEDCIVPANGIYRVIDAIDRFFTSKRQTSI